MRIRLHLILSLMLAVTLVALTFAYYQVRAEKRGLRSDLETRAEILAESLEETVAPLLQKRSIKDLLRIVERFGNRERLAGVVVYNESGSPVAVTSGLSGRLTAPPDAVAQAISTNTERGGFLTLDRNYMHFYVLPLRSEEKVVGALALFHNASHIEAQSGRIWRETLLRVSLQTLLIALITLLIIRWSIEGPIAKTAAWMRELRTGMAQPKPGLPDKDIFKPLTQEVTHFVTSLEVARAAAEEEARLREAAESLWTPERLRIHVQNRLEGSPLLVVSNREPYMHVRRGKSSEPLVPASSLGAALEPILRACDGTWIAHGGGDADREMADERARLRVPPEDPHYTLRRVWLTKEEEEGYYYGFSNEGLWPLCHIAHTRPAFRVDDWARYQEVNVKFARATEDEINGKSYIFIQDYHFSILARIIKERHPDTKVALFWHIPWPNPEAFGICPWKREIIHGMLGADIIGFHTQFHCNNFLETVDRTLECQTDWEHFSTTRMGHTTYVKPFPISVDFSPELFIKDIPSKEEIFKNLGVKASLLGLGVDSVDYTKGIPERFRTIERFLEKNPEYLGIFTFVQIGAPSREHIKRYHDLLAEVEAEADRINWNFQPKGWRPIVFIKRHLSHEEIEPYYRRADVCVVNALHDGMNLVAKEFVVSREDEQGVLILSTFTGAARELKDALLINPYDVEQTADMIKAALEMDPEDQKLRMIRMRNAVRENNIYKWAADIITDLTQIRSEQRPT